MKIADEIGIDLEIVDRVREFACEQSSAVFVVWDEDGDFMGRRAEAIELINQFASDCAASKANQVEYLQGVGSIAFFECYSALMKKWDDKVFSDAAAEERSAGMRRHRYHHVRQVYR